MASEVAAVMACASSLYLISGKALVKPTPPCCVRSISAAKNWSAQTGVATEGRPALRAACRVPMPPWWTIQQQRGKSHSCGANGTKQTLSFTNSASLPPSLTREGKRPAAATEAMRSSSAQPPMITPRRPTCISARSASSSISAGVMPSASMEPQPTATGGGPASRKFRSSWREPPGARSATCGASCNAQAAVFSVRLLGAAFLSTTSLTG
mmetsp:Transcript_52523/g.118277  ORF Transcript_52523/g.118277 Transcript_52523/m.118277 type:complete len:211 (+) Transcript_52523:239-871(+)